MIRKIVPMLLCLTIASAWSGQRAIASTTGTSLSPNAFEVRLGAFFPSSSDARFVGGQTQLSAGLSYTLSSTGGLTPSATNAYFDYMSGSKNSGYVHSGGFGLEFRTVGTGYVGAGLGLYNTSVKNAAGLTGSATGGGGKIFAGMNLGSGSSLQLDYHILPSSMGVNPSGVGLSIGFHL